MSEITREEYERARDRLMLKTTDRADGHHTKLGWAPIYADPARVVALLSELDTLTTSLAAANAGRVEAEVKLQHVLTSQVDWARSWKLGKGDTDETFTTPSKWMGRALAAEQKLATVRDVVTCAEAINLLATQRGQYYASVAGDTLYRDYMSAPNRALDEAIQRYHEALTQPTEPTP